MIRKEYAVITNTGGRETNDDCVAAENGAGGQVVIVADGVGGQGNGCVASRMAVKELLRCFREGSCAGAEAIVRAVGRCDEAVRACQSEECRMMTTIVALFMKEDQASWVHVGDSRLYHFYNAKLVERTYDHSVPQMAVMMGMITEGGIRSHPDRSRILRALGSECAEPDLAGPVSVGEGFHAFLLCTDGFWEYILEKEMEDKLSCSPNPRQWLLKMEELIRQRAPENQDNYTAAAIFTVRADSETQTVTEEE